VINISNYRYFKRPMLPRDLTANNRPMGQGANMIGHNAAAICRGGVARGDMRDP